MNGLNLARELVVRWEDPEARHVPLLREGGVTAVVAKDPPPDFVDACARAGIQARPVTGLQFVSLEELEGVGPTASAILIHGRWPGASPPPDARGQDMEVASASRQPWVDANSFWIAWLHALYPRRTPVLGYLPDENAGLGRDRMVPFDSLELALTEAWAAGGNYILSVEPRYREALLRGDTKASAAWRQLGRTARWLRDHAPIFTEPTVPIITTLVEPGEETAEIANLLFRNNASPALQPVTAPPPPDPQRRLAVVAVNLHSGRPAKAAEILAHAMAGSTVVLDDNGEPAWWKSAPVKHIREEYDRNFYRLGAGQLVVYKERVVDPSEFALDVIDIVTHKRRAVRLWGTGTVIAQVKSAPAGRGDRSLVLVNYGSPVDSEIQVRVHGVYKTATLLRPEAGPLPLKAVKRGTTTEILVPELGKTGIVLFG